MWKGQRNPRFWGFPETTQWALPCMGRGVPFPCPIPGWPLPPSFLGPQLPSPVPGSTPSHLKQAKHTERGLGARVGWEQEYDFEIGRAHV